MNRYFCRATLTEWIIFRKRIIAKRILLITG